MTQMTISPLDALLVTITLFFILLGIYRGLFREFLSLIGFLLGLYFAAHNYGKLAKWIIKWFPSFPALVNICSFLAILAVTVFIIAIIGVIFRRLLLLAELKSTDRILGGAFGLVKALFINAFIIILLVTFVPRGNTLVQRSPLARNTYSMVKMAMTFASSDMKHKFLYKWEKGSSKEEQGK